MLPWLLCGALAATALILCVRLYLLQRALDDIAAQLGERLSSDTNNLIFLPTRDAHARKLATELNVQLRQLRRQRQRYENGDRELREAVTNVSHDLRTPLTAICGYLELLDRADKTPEQARYLALIAGRAEAMRQLTEELLRYSVAASLEDDIALEPVDLNAAVEQAVASFYGALVERGITPAVSLPEGRVVRPLNPSSVSRVFGNIIGNALKYSDGDFSAVLREDGTLVFSNSARTLDPVSAARLFDRFYTVETGRGSTGLGLSIAKLLTERMGGAIQAEHRDGRLSITLRFPAAQGTLKNNP